MFGKRNLLREGAEAQAVVTAVRDGGVLTGGAGVPIHQYLDLRVSFDDGSYGESSCRVGSMLHNNTLSFSEGDIVPVRYDPADRTKIELDEPALTAQRESLREHGKEQAIARAEAELGGSKEDRGPAAGWTSGSTGEPVPAQFQVSADPARIEQMKAKLMQMAAENPGSVVRPSAAGPTSGVSDPIERLAKLADLHGRGALTDAEFAAEKAKILKNS